MHSLIGYPSRISKEPSDASLTFLNKDGTIPPYPHFSTYLGSILAIVKHHLERKIASNVFSAIKTVLVQTWGLIPDVFTLKQRASKISIQYQCKVCFTTHKPITNLSLADLGTCCFTPVLICEWKHTPFSYLPLSFHHSLHRSDHTTSTSVVAAKRLQYSVVILGMKTIVSCCMCIAI